MQACDKGVASFSIKLKNMINSPKKTDKYVAKFYKRTFREKKFWLSKSFFFHVDKDIKTCFEYERDGAPYDLTIAQA
jgi:hypothetical protein